MDSASQTRSTRGFSLIEVLVAVVILSIGLLALASLQLSLVRASATTKAQTLASNLAKDRIEFLRSYTNLAGYAALTDSPTSGTVENLTDGGTGKYGGIDYKRTTITSRFVFNKLPAPGSFVSIANTTPDATLVTASNVSLVDNIDYSIGKDFKLIKVTVEWADTTSATPNQSVAMEDIIDGLDPAESAAIVNSSSTSGGPRTLEEIILDPSTDPMVIPIALGGGVDSAATNPKPTVVAGTSTVETRFDVLTYAGLNGGTATAQSKVETAMVGCSCTLDAPLPTVRGKRPSYWNGYRYVPPLDVASSGPESYLPHGHEDPALAGHGNPGAVPRTQSELCGICCRDHEDPAGVKNATFSPRLVTRDSNGIVTTPHRHYLDKTQLVGAFATAGLYKEACRIIRVDGFWSTAADLSNDYFGLLATGDGSNANSYAPNDAAVVTYQNFVAEVGQGYMNARFVAPTPTAGTEQATYNTINRPAVSPPNGSSDLVATNLAASSRYVALHTPVPPGAVTIGTNDLGTPVCTTITNISKANPAVVTHLATYNNCAATPVTIAGPAYVTGDDVNITGVVGTMAVNTAGTSYVIRVLSATTFELAGVNSSPGPFGAYTSGGSAEVSHAKWLHSRGLYVDYLEKEAADAITFAKSQTECNTATTSPARTAAEVLSICVLKLLPFTSINLTEIADWDSANTPVPPAVATNVLSVTNNNYADTRTSTEPVRGETSFVSGANGSPIDVSSRSRLSNSSLLDLSFDSISKADDNRAPDAQTFRISNSLVFSKPGNGTFYTTLSLPFVTGLGTNYVTGTQASKSCFYSVLAGNFICVVNNAESTTVLPVDLENAGLGISTIVAPITATVAIDVVGYNSRGTATSTAAVAGCTGPFAPKTYVSGTSGSPASYTLNTCSNYAVTAASNTTLVAAALGTAPYAVTGDGTQAEKTRISFANINLGDSLSVTFGSPVTTTQTVAACTYVCTTNNAGNTDCASDAATSFTITSTACP